MTAPTNPAPLPVVASVIWHLRTRPDTPLVLAKSVHAVLVEPHPTDRDAVTVPLALFEDDEFGHAVYSRVRDLVGYLATFEVLTAIAAELRSRVQP
jgi:hypothetical protein